MRLAVLAHRLGVALLLGTAWLASPATAQSADQIRQFRMICGDTALQKRVLERARQTDRLLEVETELEERCAQLDLPSKPAHEAADPSPEASHTDWTFDARYSRDGRTIVSGSRDGTVRVWDAETGRSIRRIVIGEVPRSGDHNIVRRLTLIGDGSHVAVSSDRNPVHLIELASGKIVASFPTTSDCCGGALAGTASGLLFIGGETDTVPAVDVKTREVRYRLPGHLKEASAIAVSESARLVATAGSSRYSKPEQSPRVHLWRLETGEKIAEFELKGDGDSATALAFSRDGGRLAVFVGRSVHVYSIADRRITQTIGPILTAFDVDFTADGKGLVACGSYPILWDLATGKKARLFGPFSDLCHSVDISPDGRFALSTSMGTDLRIWEIATGTFHRRLGGNNPPRR
jgi:hypothetical protein